MFTDHRQNIVKNALSYQLKPKKQWEGQQRTKYDAWYQEIHQHFEQILLSKIQQRNEKFVEYWPAYFVVGAETKYHTKIFSDDPVYHKYGVFGTGYLCLTNQNLYLIILQNLTNKFPFLNKESGLTKFFKSVIGDNDHRAPMEGDRIQVISYFDIDATEMITSRDYGKHLLLETISDNWQIIEQFSNTLEEMTVGINMGALGNLQSIWIENVNNPKISKDSPPEVIVLLERLKELKDAGVISDREFEDKKKSLLDRI